MLKQEVTPRTALVAILAAVYVVLLLVLIVGSRRESGLVVQAAASEAALSQAVSSEGSDLATLRASLGEARDRQAVLESRIPKEVDSAMFERVAQDAQLSGISGFRYQRKGEYIETLQAGTYKVYRYSIAGRGSQDILGAFLDSIQKQSGATMVVENLSLTAAGAEWQMAAYIVVYTWGS